jgi:hypothetical protein
LPGKVIGSGMVNGVYYQFTAEGHILRVNPSTGAVTTAATYNSTYEDGPALTRGVRRGGAGKLNQVSDGNPPRISVEAQPSGFHTWPVRSLPRR